MQVTVMRDTFTDQSVTSEVLLDGEQRWFGIEPPNRANKPCCIPAGTYAVTLGTSEHFDMIVPMVQSVPGFTGIEIHPGNFPQDTHGCLCIGLARFANEVTQSRDAFEQFIQKLMTQTDPISITYVGGV